MEENKLSKIKRLLDQLATVERFDDLISDPPKGVTMPKDGIDRDLLKHQVEQQMRDLANQLIELGWDFDNDGLLIPLAELDAWSYSPRQTHEDGTMKVNDKANVKVFSKQLDFLMEKFQLRNHVTIYTPTPDGSMLSYSDDSALREAHSCINAQVARKFPVPSQPQA